MIPIEEQNRFLNRPIKPYWDDAKRMYSLNDCACCGGRGEDVVTIYAGTGGFSSWNIFCRKCKLRASGGTEKEAVDKWNRGETYRRSNS